MLDTLNDVLGHAQLSGISDALFRGDVHTMISLFACKDTNILAIRQVFSHIMHQSILTMVVHSSALQHGEDIIPNQIEFTLQIPDIRSNGNNGILIGNHDDILSSGSISTETARSATPHLIAIALHPVTGLFSHTLRLGFFHTGARINALHLLLRHFSHPFSWNQLTAIPLSFLEEQLSHLGQIFGLQIETPATRINT